ncbi:hypothetical protein CCAL6883_09090 [Campylobacter sp. RM6883]|uniref:phage holin family protein n=1 Tax=Campylobacter californiensis TaxID=1032243 RepID=UPI001452A5B8|nr:phage holin family protein [Campylobacter sp. RM6914]MBE2985483.1 hypothetical protein [Campylobacter sp. RM6883]MBE2995898.1 hypothetical protein [Campylobacter sp. RM6913]QCD51213.1 hypothetical protein CCAL_1328 [Campylobacter sp. RM6914]
MNKFLEDLTNKPFFWVVVMGFIGGLLNLADPKKSNAHNALNIITGIAGSMFLCYLAYEATFYFTQVDRISVAVGGFFAWRGANWANEMVDKAIKSRINKPQDDYRGYGYGNEVPPIPRNLDEKDNF